MLPPPAVTLHDLSKRFPGNSHPALDALNAQLPEQAIVGVVGPDAAGKTTLLRILAGLMAPTGGEALLFGTAAREEQGGSRDFVGYMPQRFGLYEDLKVIDNLRLHASLRGVSGPERDEVFGRLLEFTDLKRFSGRLAGKLSGGMKQKLGLACALLGSPRLLLLDEPGVGVDPLSRQELWTMVESLRGGGMSVIWSTAYMDEAERCAWVLMLDAGRLIWSGPPQDFTAQVKGRTFYQVVGHGQASDTEAAMEAWYANPSCLDIRRKGGRLALLLANAPEDQTRLTPRSPALEDAYMDAVGGINRVFSPFLRFPPVQDKDEAPNSPRIEAVNLTKKFENFTAADNISFRIMPGKIFGLLGPNGAGKSTTFRMLCGLSRPSAGVCFVGGVNLLKAPGQARKKLGYMAQKFSLYGDLTVEQNLRLCAKLYSLDKRTFKERGDMLLEALELEPYLRTQSHLLPLGQKQRLALLCATLHGPEALFLDEPTSGVDPRTRRDFWKHIRALTTTGVSVLVTTHFMEEAEYCDELALIYRGVMIASGTPETLKSACRSPDRPDPDMEEAFIMSINSYDREHDA